MDEWTGEWVTDRHMDRQIGRPTEGRQIDRKTSRQEADKQAVGQTKQSNVAKILLVKVIMT